MMHSEQVAFTGSGAVDRAAHLRGNIGPVLADPTARGVVLWRGKAALGQLVDGQRQAYLVAPGDALLEQATAPVFLGLVDGAPRFGWDISAWEPEASDAAEGGFLDRSEQVHPAMPDGVTFADLRSTITLHDPLSAELLATAKAIFGWHDSHRFCARCGAPSDIAQAGWQRNCPSCKTAHFPRTDPVVIMLVTNGQDLLLGRSPGWPDGMYSLLAGFVEPGETLEAAVRREVWEETQVTTGQVGYLSSQPWPFPTSLMIGMQAQATSRDITLDPVELEDALWISRDELAEVFAGNSDRVKPARPGSIAYGLMRDWLADRLPGQAL